MNLFHENILQLGFLVPPDSVPGRLGMLVTLFLCQTNTLNDLVTKGPRGSNGTTYLIQWVLICTCFIIAAMLEYGFILMTVVNKKDAHKIQACNIFSLFYMNLQPTAFFSFQDSFHKKKLCKTNLDSERRPAFKLDMAMLALFPVSFAVTVIAFICLS